MHDGVPGRARGPKSQRGVIGDVGAACRARVTEGYLSREAIGDGRPACRARIIEVYLCQDGAEDGCGPRRAITIEIDDTPLVANVNSSAGTATIFSAILAQ